MDANSVTESKPRGSPGERDSYLTPRKKQRLSLGGSAATPLDFHGGSINRTRKRSYAMSDPLDRLIDAQPASLALNPLHFMPLLKTTPRTTRFAHSLHLTEPAPSTGHHLFDRALTPRLTFASDHSHHALHPALPGYSSSSTSHLRWMTEVTLDAPGLLDDFYTNNLSWSHQDVAAVALDKLVYIKAFRPGDLSIACLHSGSKIGGNIPCGLTWAPSEGPSNTLAIGLRNGKVMLKDASKMETVAEYTGPTQRAASIAWNGSSMVSGHGNGALHIYDTKAPRREVGSLKAHNRCITGLAFKPDGRLLLTGGGDYAVRLWDIRMLGGPKRGLSGRDQHVWEWRQRGCVKALAWCPWQSNLFACGAGTEDGHVYFRTSHDGETLGALPFHAQITSVHFSKHCKEIVTTTGFSGAENTPKKSHRHPRIPKHPRTSLAFITRPHADMGNKTIRKPLWKTQDSSSVWRAGRGAIITHRLPSLKRLVTIPYPHHGRITTSAMNHQGTHLLTAGAEMLQVRTLWGQPAARPRDVFDDDLSGVIR